MANKDNTAPKLVLSSPKKGSSDVSVTQDLIFVFNKDIKAGLGNIVISNGGADSQTISLSAIQTASSQFSIVGKTLIINPQKPLQPNSHYSVKIDSTAIQGLSGNKYAGISNATTVFFDTVDTLAPFMTKSLPTINTANVAPKANIVLTFNEKIQAGRGNITLISDADSRTIAISDKQITISGNTLIFNPSADFNVNSSYALHLDAGAINDAALKPNAISAIDLNFNTLVNGDKQAPVLQTYSGKGEVSDNLQLVFQEPIKLGRGNFTLNDGTTQIVIPASDTKQVSIQNNILTINPWRNLNPEKMYTLISPKGILTDIVGNAFAGLSAKNAFTFDTHDKTSPTLTITDDKGALTNSSILYTFTLSEPSNTFNADSISVIGAQKGVFTSLNPTKYTLNVLPNANSTASVTVEVASGAFTDFAGNGNIASEKASQAVDTLAPTLLNTSPVNQSIDVVKNSNISLFFNENISAGSGDFIISNGVDSQTISVKDATQVFINNKVLILNPSKDLVENTAYNLTFSEGVILDKSGNAFAGFALPTQFTLKTQPPATTTKDTAGQTQTFVDKLNAKALDGYLKGATVFADKNGNGIQDPDEASAITDEYGNFELTDPEGSLVLSGGTDLSTGKPFSGTLRAPEGSSVVTPLTTVQQGFIDAGQSPAQAEKSVAKAFGFDSEKLDLTTYDPIAEIVKTGTSSETQTIAAQIMASSAQIANFLVTTSQVLQGAAGGSDNLSQFNASNALIKSLVTAISKDESTGDGKIDLADAALLNIVIVDGAKEVQKSASSADVPYFDAENFIAKMDKISATLTEVLKSAADNISAAVANSKDGNGLALLGNLDKVSSFVQNNAGQSLQDVAVKFDIKNPNAIDAALRAQKDAFTGDAATKAIQDVVVDTQKSVGEVIAADASVKKANKDARILEEKRIADEKIALAKQKLIDEAAQQKRINDAAQKLIDDAAQQKRIDDAAQKLIDDAAQQKRIDDAAQKLIDDAAQQKRIDDAAQKLIDDAAQQKRINDAAQKLIDDQNAADLAARTKNGGSGDDNLTGTSGDDTIKGFDGDDLLVGGFGNDSLVGGSGDDALEGGRGDDIIDGGADQWGDIVDYRQSPRAVNVRLGEGTVPGSANGGDGNDTLINIEHIFDSHNSDNLIGNSRDNIFKLSVGDDTVDGGAGHDVVSYEDYEESQGGIFVDLNAVSVLPNSASINSSSSPTVSHLLNIEGIQGSYFNDTILLKNGQDGEVFGRQGNDSLVGGNLNDYLVGGSGNDTINGGDGFDMVSYLDDGFDAAFNRLLNTPTPITIHGVVVDLSTGTATDNWGNTDTLSSIEAVEGSVFNDSITGSSGNVFISGDQGNDTLKGGLGDDFLSGGQGSDTLDGGEGHDAFLFGPNASLVGISLDVIENYASDIDELQFMQPNTNPNPILASIMLAKTLERSNIQVNPLGFISFNSADDTYDKKVDAIQLDAELDAPNQVALFTFGSDSYIYYSGAAIGNADDQIIRLSGVLGTGIKIGSQGAITSVNATTYSKTEGIKTTVYNLGGNIISVSINTAGLTSVFDASTQPTCFSAPIDSNGLIYNYYIDTVTTRNLVKYSNTSSRQFLDPQGVSHVQKNTTFFNINGQIQNSEIIDTFTISGVTHVNQSLISKPVIEEAGNEIRNGEDKEIIGGTSTTIAIWTSTTIKNYEGSTINGRTETRNYSYSLNYITKQINVFANDGHLLSSAQTITGSSGDDFLVGSFGNDSITGGEGNDNVDGGGGNDTIDGGTGNDTLIFSNPGTYVDAQFARISNIENLQLSGESNVTLGSNAATITKVVTGTGITTITSSNPIAVNALASANLILLGSGAITAKAGVTAMTIDGSGATGALTLMGNSGANTIYGGAGSDFLNGMEGSDSISGGLGDDFISGDLGNDSIDGGDGADSIQEGDGSDLISGGSGDDFISGDQGNDSIDGGDGSDHIQGGAGSDSINGGSGDDFISGGQGSDTIDGGAGYDMISYRNFDYQNPPGISGAGVVVNLLTGNATDNWGNTDTLTNIENIEDSPYNDMLIGNTADNFFSLSVGVDTVDGGGGHDTVSYENATSGIVMGPLVPITPSSAQPVNVSSKTSPIGQTADKAIDGKADTKYLNFDIHNTGLTVTFSSPAIINSIRLTTAGDMPGRDPASFEIFGINNDGSFVNITTQPIPIALGVSGTNQGIRELTSGFYNFNNTNAYSTYKIVFPKVMSDSNQSYYTGNNAGLNQYNNNSMQIADIYFYHLPNISNIEDTIGSNYNDSLIGNNDPNLIDGKNGDDILNGGAGVDTLVGGVGSDTFVFNLGDLGFPDLSSQTLSNLNITDVITDFVSKSDKIDFGIPGRGIKFVSQTSVVSNLANLLTAVNTINNTSPNNTDGKILFYFGVIASDGYLVTEDDAGVISNIIQFSGVTSLDSIDIVGL